MVLRRSREEALGLTLLAIRDLTASKGYAPTYREIGLHINRAPSLAYGYVRALEQAGLVHDEPNIARTLRVTPAGSDRLAATVADTRVAPAKRAPKP